MNNVLYKFCDSLLRLWWALCKLYERNLSSVKMMSSGVSQIEASHFNKKKKLFNFCWTLKDEGVLQIGKGHPGWDASSQIFLLHV